MSSTDKVAEYFDSHVGDVAQEEKEPMGDSTDSTQKLNSYGVEKVHGCDIQFLKSR